MSLSSGVRKTLLIAADVDRHLAVIEDAATATATAASEIVARSTRLESMPPTESASAWARNTDYSKI